MVWLLKPENTLWPYAYQQKNSDHNGHIMENMDKPDHHSERITSQKHQLFFKKDSMVLTSQ